MPKTTGFYHGCMRDGYIILKPSDERDMTPLNKIFEGKQKREAKNGQEILLNVTLDAPFQKRTVKEINTAWKLISIIFESMNGRRGTESELYALYEDLLTDYADKTPCTLYPERLRPVRLSEANTIQAADFIDGLLFHLSQVTGLSQDLQADVRSVIYDWEEWRGQHSPDYTSTMTEEKWRMRATYSEASGIGGQIDLHHMITKGAHPEFKDDPENWIALNRSEHREFHDKGEEAFIQKYPHLEGRFKRAHEKLAEITKKNQIGVMAETLECSV